MFQIHKNAYKFLVLILFIASGSITPLIIQTIAMNGGSEPSTMLIFLPSFVGMSFAILTNLSVVNKGTIDWKLMVFISAIDLTSSKLVFQGLVWTGTTIYTVVNCSITLFTAIFATTFLQRQLQPFQWVGIFVVTCGLCIIGYGSQGEGEMVMDGIALILVGAMIHAMSYIVTEKILLLTEDPIAPELMCSLLGGMGLSFNLFWQAVYTYPRWQELVVDEVAEKRGDVRVIFVCYGLIVCTTVVNSTCFYYLLGKFGSASLGVMKGLQAVTTFVSSHYAFCSIQETQCFTPLKGTSLVVVLVGVTIYSIARKSSKVKPIGEPEVDNMGDKLDPEIAEAQAIPLGSFSPDLGERTPLLSERQYQQPRRYSYSEGDEDNRVLHLSIVTSPRSLGPISSSRPASGGSKRYSCMLEMAPSISHTASTTYNDDCSV